MLIGEVVRRGMREYIGTLHFALNFSVNLKLLKGNHSLLLLKMSPI